MCIYIYIYNVIKYMNKNMHQKLAFPKAGAMRCIMDGATWPATRRKQADMIESDLCSRCQLEPEGAHALLVALSQVRRDQEWIWWGQLAEILHLPHAAAISARVREAAYGPCARLLLRADECHRDCCQ